MISKALSLGPTWAIAAKNLRLYVAQQRSSLNLAQYNRLVAQWHEARFGSKVKRIRNLRVEVIRKHPAKWHSTAPVCERCDANAIPPIPTVPCDGPSSNLLRAGEVSYLRSSVGDLLGRRAAFDERTIEHRHEIVTREGAACRASRGRSTAAVKLRCIRRSHSVIAWDGTASPARTGDPQIHNLVL